MDDFWMNWQFRAQPIRISSVPSTTSTYFRRTRGITPFQLAEPSDAGDSIEHGDFRPELLRRLRMLPPGVWVRNSSEWKTFYCKTLFTNETSTNTGCPTLIFPISQYWEYKLLNKLQFGLRDLIQDMKFSARILRKIYLQTIFVLNPSNINIKMWLFPVIHPVTHATQCTYVPFAASSISGIIWRSCLRRKGAADL